jgi:hypothetical protein
MFVRLFVCVGSASSSHCSFLEECFGVKHGVGGGQHGRGRGGWAGKDRVGGELDGCIMHRVHTSCMNWKRCNSSYIWYSHSNATHYNSVTILLLQLIFIHYGSYDYNHNIMLTSFFIHSSKFNKWHNQKLSCGILIEFWKPIYI